MQDAKRRAIIFAVLSIILATLAGLLFLQESNQLYAGLGQGQTVYIAKKDISSREPLRLEYFEPREIPEKYVNPSMVVSSEQMKGKVSVVPIKKGEQLTTNILRSATQLSNEDSRVVLLRSSERVSFDEALTSQDRVDIIVSYEKDPKTGVEEPSTEIFMKDKPVITVSENQKAVGLELSLEEAQNLIKAENFAHSIRILKAPQKKDIQP